jgi:hypothetical protein
MVRGAQEHELAHTGDEGEPSLMMTVERHGGTSVVPEFYSMRPCGEPKPRTSMAIH